jgi:hypothetical protein
MLGNCFWEISAKNENKKLFVGYSWKFDVKFENFDYKVACTKTRQNDYDSRSRFIWWVEKVPKGDTIKIHHKISPKANSNFEYN